MPTCPGGNSTTNLWNWMKRRKFDGGIKRLTDGCCQGGGQITYCGSRPQDLHQVWFQKVHHGGDRQHLTDGEELHILLF